MPLLATIGTAAEQAYGYVTYAKDRFFSLVTMLISGSGTNASNNNTILDSSSNNFTVTRFGNVAQGTFTPFSRSVGFWSNYFDGTGDYLSVAGSSNLAFGTGDFTIECFINMQSLVGFIYDSRTAGSQLTPCIYITGSTIVYYVGGAARITSATVATNQWYHLVVSRVSSNTRMFLNGVQTGSTYADTTNYINNTNRPFVGANGDATSSFYFGYISNIRVLVGTGTTAPTVPTTPLTAVTNTQLLTCQNNRFIDNSSNNFAITKVGDTRITTSSPFYPIYSPNLYNSAVSGGSLNFDGSGDYLTLTGSSNLAFGANDFTIECWVYLTALPAVNGMLYDSRPTSDGAYPCIFIAVTTNVLTYYVNTGYRITGTTALKINQWYYVVASRVSGNTRLFLNGVQEGSTYVDSVTYLNGANRPIIGNNGLNLNGTITGFVSNLRVLNGTGTTAPTVPTAPLTAITNTQLLLSGTNANIYDASASANVETAGSAQISNAVIKYGNGSVKFNGTTDYLSLSSYSGTGQSVLPVLGDFTVEGWVYPQSFAAQYTLFCLNSNTTSYASFRLDTTSTGALQLLVSFNGIGWTINVITSQTLSLNTWAHIAFVRTGGTMNLYLNGVQVSTNTFTVSVALMTGTQSYLGVLYNAGFAQYFNGYMSNVRVTQIARYTTTFTPPTGMFPVQG